MSATLKQPYDSPIAQEAARLTTKGLTVVPCLEDKRPTCKWSELAAKNPTDALRLWRLYPGPLIGVVTGAASNLAVLDVDLDKGGDEWHAEHAHRLVGFRMHQSRSVGAHYLFQHREGMRNSASRISPGIDIRAEGGYIIWWPAAGFQVHNNIRPGPMPAWLVEMAMPAPPPKADLAKIDNGLKDADRYITAAVRGAVANVASAPSGRRNDTLNAETYALARFVQDGHLSVSQIAECMAAAGIQAGLTQHEIERTVASAIRARLGVN